ncbi:hypothetical protein [Pasteuria penetrans]|uniref:hypothetical protein n=1 Tax=Pasteuria penetrans TaxID=86005 RepID=UPI00165B4B42|nr:hypothetical protein [Pasteuria penetrans]
MNKSKMDNIEPQISKQCDRCCPYSKGGQRGRAGCFIFSVQGPVDLPSLRSLQGGIDDIKRLLGSKELEISRLGEKTGGK